MDKLPPSVIIRPTSVGVSVLAGQGVTVQVNLPCPRGLHDLPDAEIAERARRLAKSALMSAAEQLETA